MVKKITAKALLLVYVFNFFGYHLLFHYSMQNANEKAEMVLESGGYDRKDLKELRMPVPTPYVTDQADYERIEGQLEYHGVVYNYVKRRITRDTIYIQFLPDSEKTRLSKVRIAMEKDLTDRPSGKKAGGEKRVGFSDKYDRVGFTWNCRGAHEQQPQPFAGTISPLEDVPVEVSSPPPRTA